MAFFDILRKSVLRILLVKKMKERTKHVELDKSVMDIIKHHCRRDQRISEYILELIQFRETHDRNE